MPQLCAVVGEPAGDAGEQEVRAQCWGTGLDLGRAERFRSFLNLRLEATVVALERYGETRVLLLRAGPDGKPQVEDVSGELALAAGRGPWAKLDGVALEFGEFTGRGRIGIRGNAGNPPGRAKAGQEPAAPGLDVAQHIEQASRRQPAASAGEQQ